MDTQHFFAPHVANTFLYILGGEYSPAGPMSHSVSQPTMYAGGQALLPAPSPMAHSPSLSNIQPSQGSIPDCFAKLFSWGFQGHVL